MDSNTATEFRGDYQSTKLKTDSSHVMIRIYSRPNSTAIAQPVLLFIVITSILWLGSIHRTFDVTSTVCQQSIDSRIFLPMLLKDLANAGLLNPGDHAVFLTQVESQHMQIMDDLNLHLVSMMDDDRHRSFLGNSLDFVFTDGFDAATEQFISSVLKIGGIAAVQMSGNALDVFYIPLDFEIVYLRQFGATIMVMKKTGGAIVATPKEQLLATKRTAVEGLEDLLLEPPHIGAIKPHFYHRKTKYLPELIDDSLNRYPRRVFVDLESQGDSASGRRWFEQNYPTRGLKFEMYEVEAVSSAPLGMSEWLRRTVMEDEYVVMKAEAEVVEEIFSSKAIFLVDELFMECKHEGQKRKKTNRGGKSSRRPYWQCLALCGKLRDQGVAVHQWWG